MSHPEPAAPARRPIGMTFTAALLGAVLATTAPLAPAVGAPTPAGEPSAPYAVARFEPSPEDPAELTEAWELWKERRFDAYATRVRLSCFCLVRPVTVTDVVAGVGEEPGDTVTSVTRRGHDRELGRRGYPVDRLFRMLSEAYAEADAVEVTYGARGLPRDIVVDWFAQAVDDEQYYRARQHRLPLD